MANRTLRRSYNRTEQSVQSDAIADGSDESTTGQSELGVSEPDSSVDGDGSESVREFVSDSGSVRVVEIDPERIDEFIANGGSDSGDGNSEPRKRRKYTRRNATGRKKAQETIAPFLMLAHNWASVLLKTPELSLSEDEAKKLDEAYVSFCEYHDVPALSPKRMSEINLIAAACMVYGPRFVAWRNRVKDEARLKRAKNVTNINQQPIMHPNQQVTM